MNTAALTEAAPLRAEAERIARSLAAATFGGMVLGFLIGGVGGRLAMRLVFLTSPERVRGLRSDDGFIIGQFGMVETLNLLALGAVAGVIGGLVYFAIRHHLPRRIGVRSALCGVGAGVVIGSLIVHPDGVDFTILQPRWLSIVLFVSIPALFGALAPVVIEKLDKPECRFHTTRKRTALLPLGFYLFPPLAIVAALPVLSGWLLWWRSMRSDRTRQYRRGPLRQLDHSSGSARNRGVGRSGAVPRRRVSDRVDPLAACRRWTYRSQGSRRSM